MLMVHKMFDRKKKNNNHFWGSYIFKSTSLYFELHINQNENSNPGDLNKSDVPVCGASKVLVITPSRNQI